MRLPVLAAIAVLLSSCSRDGEAGSARAAAQTLSSGGLRLELEAGARVVLTPPTGGRVALQTRGESNLVHFLAPGDPLGIERGEEWRAVPGGFEQTWRYPDAAALPDQVVVELSGVGPGGDDADGVHLAIDGATTTLHYGHGTLIDAAGWRWAVPAHLVGRAITLAIPSEVRTSARFPVVLDPLVTVQVEVSPPALGWAPGIDLGLGLAGARNGTRSLFVWSDSRAAVGTGFSGNLYGSVVDEVASGNATTSFLIAPAGAQPTVAASSTGFLVVWVGASGGTSDLFSAMIPLTGATTQPVAVQLTSTVAQAEGAPSVTPVGTGFVVAYECAANAGPICGLRLDANGGLVPNSQLVLASATGQQRAPSVGWDGTRVLVAWEDTRTGTRTVFYGSASDGGALVPAGGVRVTPTINSNQSAPSLASSLTAGSFITWSDTRAGFSNPDIYAARIDTAGQVVDDAGAPVDTDVGSQSTSDVTWDSQANRWLLHWASVTPDGGSALRAQSLGTNLGVFSNVMVRQAASVSPFEYAVAGPVTQGTARIAWRKEYIVEAITDVGLGVWPLSRAVTAQYDVTVAAGGPGSLVVWSEFGGNDAGFDLFFRRLSPAGAWLDPSPQVLASGSGDQRAPSAAWGAGVWMVAWQDAFFRSRVGRVSDQGVALDGPGVLVASSQAAFRPRVAFDGTNFPLVCETAVAGFGFGRTHLMRFSPAAVPLDLDAGIRVFAADFASAPTVTAGLGGQLLVTATATPTPGSSPGHVVAARIMGNTVLDATPISLPGDAGFSAVTFDGTDYVVAWADYRAALTASDVFAAHITSAGQVREPAGFAIDTGPRNSFSPSLTFDGVHVVLAWTDAAQTGSSWDVHLRWLNLDGGTLAQQDFVGAQDEFGPQVTSFGSRTVHLALEQNSGFATHRAAVVVAAALPTGMACGSTSDCVSGFCVTGVCCDRACTGTCESCLQASGASADGVCSLKPATTVCRASLGSCDPQESCTGATAICPPDGRTVMGTVCRAAAGDCDAPERCDGLAVNCPADGVVDAGVECLSSTQTCARPGACDGTSVTCPSLAPLPQDTTCRPAAGACDVEERCDGVSLGCPTDRFAASTQSCRASLGSCDPQESCTGATATCPPDEQSVMGTVCRAAAGDCDVAERCDGLAVNCPADGVVDAGVECLSSTQTCARPGACDGTGITCPSLAPLPQDTTCRPAAGACDVEERCDGVSLGCPTDRFAASTQSCRAAADLCDVEERCDGATATCPVDRFVAANVTCRPAADAVCDVAESCTGSGPACPGDTLSAEKAVCTDSVGQAGQCRAGQCKPVLSQYGYGCAGCSSGGGSLGLVGLITLLALSRRRSTSASRALVAVLVLTAPLAVQAAERQRLALLGVTPGAGVSPEAARTVSDFVQSELTSLAIYDVTSPADIATLLGIERQKQLLGCEETSCATELAGALDASRILQGDLSRLDEIVIFNLSLIDARTARVIHRVGRRVESPKGVSRVLDEVKSMLVELLNAAPEQAARPVSFVRGFGGFSVGARVEVDVLAVRAAGSITGEWATRWVGVALTLIPKAAPGLRLEARFYPLEVGVVRLHAAAGVVAFTTGVGLHGRLGLTFALGSLRLGLDAGWEQFLWAGDGFRTAALVAGGGASWAL